MPQAAIHKNNLVRTAMRLFRRQGFASTGLQQILDESGAPKGSLYHYFPGGKEALGEAAVELAGTLVQETLVDLAKRHEEPSAFVRGYCRVMAGWMAESGFRSGSQPGGESRGLCGRCGLLGRWGRLQRRSRRSRARCRSIRQFGARGRGTRPFGCHR